MRHLQLLKAATLLLSLIFFQLTSSCTDREPSRPDQGPSLSAAPIQIVDGSGLLFSFFNHKGELLTVERTAEVEPQARAEVEVINPRKQLSGGRTFVADLRKRLDNGKYRVWIEPRGAWLQRNMPKVTLLEKPVKVAAAAAPKKKKTTKKRPRRKRRSRRRKPPPAAVATKAKTPPITEPASSANVQPPANVQPTSAKVFLFSTAWCPSCKQARAYLRSRNIAFIELDVEKNPQAAQQYVAVCQRAGLKQGAVPVIVIGGQVFQGFSKLQVDGALSRAGLL